MPIRESCDRTLDEVLKAHGLGWDLFADVILDASRNGCVTVAYDGRVLFANKVAREELGIRPGTALADRAPELLARLEGVLDGEEDPGGQLLARGEATYLTKVTRVQVGSALLGALCVFIDMTNSEAALRQMRAYAELIREQEAIINSLDEGIWISDSEAVVQRINPASERLNHIKAAEVVGRSMRDLVAAGVFDRSATLEVLARGVPVTMLQSREGRKLVLTGIPVLDDAGRIFRVVVTERDITEVEALQKELEEQEAMRDRYRDRLLELQVAEVESRRVIARSECMQLALRQAIRVASVDSTVLMTGESGVGKELFADLICRYSDRSGKPLVKINCGAIPESLVEAELFGYEKGAFTGAQSKGKPGYFELADGGILFLDEVGELPLASQVKLLRFLEDGRVTRVGATQGRKLDVRILAATHQDLRAMVERGSFRLDLYYRLSVIPISIPPLRQRTECILPLLQYYLELFAGRHGVHRRFTRAASDALLAYAWPGNVRELANLCERLVVMADSELIGLNDLPQDVRGGARTGGAAAGAQSLARMLEDTERALLVEARKRHGSQALMAKALGIDQSTVARKLKRYAIH